MPEQHLAFLILILLRSPMITDNRKLYCTDSFQAICIIFTSNFINIASIICNFNLTETEKITKIGNNKIEHDIIINQTKQVLYH